MQSEGPYKHIRFPRFEVEPTCSMSCPACAYAEGRKAAEQDLNDLLRMANKLRGFDEVFYAWKKARGIE